MHTVKHSLVDEKVIQYFLRDYGLSPFSEVQFLTRGLNDTYIVRTGVATYIYRIYRYGWRSREAIMFELESLEHLYAKGFPASYPVKRNDGTYLCDIHAPEGLRYGVMFTYTNGERPPINVDNTRVLGKSLADLHNVTEDFRPRYSRGFELDTDHLIARPKRFITPALHRYLGEESVQAFEEIAEHLQEKLQDKELEMGYSHGDFHNHNLHIADGEIEVFDFDCSGMGYRAYDVATAWWNLLHNYQKQEEECWEAFLDGYFSRRELSTDDLASLPAFISIRRIWLLGTMLANDDVWGTNWMNRGAFEIFMLQLKSDTVRERKDNQKKGSD